MAPKTAGELPSFIATAGNYTPQLRFYTFTYILIYILRQLIPSVIFFIILI